MTAYHRAPFLVLPLSHDEKLRTTVFAHSIPLSQSLSFLEVKGDLLPDLWSTPATSSPYSQTARPGYSLWAQTSPQSLLPALLAHLPHYAHANCAQLPSPVDFALAPLTEENLTTQEGFGRRSHSYSENSNEDLFLFEQQVMNVPNMQMHGPNVQIATPNMHTARISHTLLPSYTPNLPAHSHNLHNFASNPQATPKSYKTAQSRPYGFQEPPKQPQHVNTQLYKTELCASFIKLGLCPYGNKCQFAHGENELKSVDRPPKWRSKQCANWAKFGSCRYGNRCCFKHGRD